MELIKALAIAEEIKGLLSSGCKRIEIAGSCRRKKPYPNDIEILAIPIGNRLDQIIHHAITENILALRVNKRGSITYGPKNKLMVHCQSGIGVDIFTTDELCWAVSLVVRTGGKENNVRIATEALNRGWKFRACGDGFDTPDGHVHCSNEREVFEKVGLLYLPPERRS